MSIQISAAAKELHDSCLVLDCHSHFLINGYLFNRPFDHPGPSPRHYNPFRNSLSLQTVKKGGIKALAFTAYTIGRPLFWHTDATTHRILDRYDAIVAQTPGTRHCTSAAEIRKAVADGQLALFPAIEGGHVLEGKLENLEAFYKRGVRLLTLTHFVSNGIADAAQSPYKPLGGLSPFGREVVATMQSMGMLVDVAHCSDKAIYQIADITSGPIVCSHSGLRRFKPLKRNLGDRAVRLVAETKGLFGIILFANYLGDPEAVGTSIRAAARTARVVADMTSPDILCLGSDMDGFTWLPKGMRDASDLPQFTQALMDEGFSQDEIRGILGENFLRVYG